MSTSAHTTMLAILNLLIAYTVAQSTNQNQTWPPNTTATGSTEHPHVGSYDFNSSNAIDKKKDTSWTDDTWGGYPDILTIESPVAVTLDGIILLSDNVGVPVDFTVDANNGSGWTQGAKITGNTEVLQFIKFPRSLLCSQLRLEVTLAQTPPSPHGEFTRISELSPVYAAPSNTLSKNDNTTAIVAGVLGAFAGVLILALIAAVLLLRRQRNNNCGITPLIDKHHHHPGPPSSSYTPELTAGGGVPLMVPPPSSLSSLYAHDHYSNTGNIALDTSASVQSHNQPMATNTSSSYPSSILGITVDNRRPTEVPGTSFSVELPTWRAKDGH